MTTPQDKPQTTAVAKAESTSSEKFTNMVIREYTGLAGEMAMTPYQQRLAQHLFIKIDASLKALEAKRLSSNQKDKQPIVWANINMTKLAIDAVHRVDLGLDGLIPNHIHPIPYWNSKEAKYDLDLRVGYVGKDYYRRKVSLSEPIDIIYELVYSTDTFHPIKRSLHNEVESYEFVIVNPFERGEIIGGFGYIMYEDSRKNRMVILTEKDFQRSKALAKSSEFWTNNPTEMRYKTLVLRTTDKMLVDPEKINESYMVVESDEDEAELAEEIRENANRERIDVDMGTGEITEAPQLQAGMYVEADPSPPQPEATDTGPGF